jgi:transketolase N-terminal domain/subunit
MNQPTSRPNRPLANMARARLLQMHYEAKVGHIGGNLSALDAMLHLHGQVMTGTMGNRSSPCPETGVEKH